jgi:hypothetical protein
MNKIIYLNILASSILSADTFINPLPNSVKSIDNGGVKSAIDAYQDGIGAELIDKPGVATDNSAMNTLVLKYGEAAKSNNVTIVDQVVYGTGTEADKIIAGKLTINGATCNDSNVNTIGETWLNGVCQGGTVANGTICDDNNAQTINDIYTNNICSGTNVEGQICDDNSYITKNDTYHNGVCAGTTYTNAGLQIYLPTEKIFSNSTSVTTFTGNSYCQNFTISFFAKTTSTTGFSAAGHIPGGTEQYLFSPTHGGTTFDGVGVSIGTNGVATYEHSSGNLPINGSSSYILGTGWNKITYVYQNSIPKLYINGAYITTGITSPRGNACSPTGYGFGSYSKAVNASVKNILIYNNALTASEVALIPN